MRCKCLLVMNIIEYVGKEVSKFFNNKLILCFFFCIFIEIKIIPKCRSPPLSISNFEIEGGKNMNKNIKGERLGSYIVFNINSDYIAKFKSITGEIRIAKISKNVKEELERQKKEDKSQANKFDRYIEHLSLTEKQMNKRAIHKSKSIEETFFENEREIYILREIWNLPIPQNRRVYMRIINEFSLTEIAKIEKCSIPAVKKSVEAGIKKLQKKLKNF